MPALAILSIAFTVVMLVLSIIFKVAGKLRLTLPVLFFLLMAFPFNRWASANETLVGDTWRAYRALSAVVDNLACKNNKAPLF